MFCKSYKFIDYVDPKVFDHFVKKQNTDFIEWLQENNFIDRNIIDRLIKKGNIKYLAKLQNNFKIFKIDHFVNLKNILDYVNVLKYFEDDYTKKFLLDRYLFHYDKSLDFMDKYEIDISIENKGMFRLNGTTNIITKYRDIIVCESTPLNMGISDSLKKITNLKKNVNLSVVYTD